VLQIRVKDSGSVTQFVKLSLQGISVYGIIDSDADINIIGGQLFKHVALAAQLREKDLMRLGKTYDQKPFTFDGRIDLDIVFEDKATRTPIYVNMISSCCLKVLGILSYYDKVEQWRGGKGKHNSDYADCSDRFPMVKVRIIKTVRLLPYQKVRATVEFFSNNNNEHDKPFLQSDDVLFKLSGNGYAHLMLSNPSGCMHVIYKGTCIGRQFKYQMTFTKRKSMTRRSTQVLEGFC